MSTEPSDTITSYCLKCKAQTQSEALDILPVYTKDGNLRTTSARLSSVCVDCKGKKSVIRKIEYFMDHPETSDLITELFNSLTI